MPHISKIRNAASSKMMGGHGSNMAGIICPLCPNRVNWYPKTWGGTCPPGPPTSGVSDVKCKNVSFTSMLLKTPRIKWGIILVWTVASQNQEEIRFKGRKTTFHINSYPLSLIWFSFYFHLPWRTLRWIFKDEKCRIYFSNFEFCN